VIYVLSFRRRITIVQQSHGQHCVTYLDGVVRAFYIWPLSSSLSDFESDSVDPIVFETFTCATGTNIDLFVFTLCPPPTKKKKKLDARRCPAADPKRLRSRTRTLFQTKFRSHVIYCRAALPRRLNERTRFRNAVSALLK
jgi:hypothetical protein